MVTHNDINQIAVTNALFGQYIVVGVTFKRLKRKDFDWDREWRRNTRKKVWVSLGWALTLNNRIYSQDLLLVKKIERIWKFLFRLNGIEHLTWNLQRNTWEQSSNQKQMQHRVRSHFYSHLHSALRGATLRCFLPKSLESSQANLHTVQHPRLVRAQEEIAQMFGVTAKMKNQQPWGSLKNAGLEGNVEEGLPCSNQRNDMEWEGRRGALTQREGRHSQFTKPWTWPLPTFGTLKTFSACNAQRCSSPCDQPNACSVSTQIPNMQSKKNGQCEADSQISV